MKLSIHVLIILASIGMALPIASQQEKPPAAVVPAQAWRMTIVDLEPTVLFPRQPAGQPLKQRAILHLDNPAYPVNVVATIIVGDNAPYTEDLGMVPYGKSALPLSILDISKPSKVTVIANDQDSHVVIDKKEWNWQPQKKWKLYSVSYSHHDLGYGNYPHQIRTDIRHGNIERALEFSRETDSWEDDSKYRFMIETSEPITSFLSSHSDAEAAELGRRIREGRIQIGGFHSTVSTEQMSQELMARLFYLSLRHTPDLLGVPHGNTAQIDDVIGLTWPLATYIKAAGLPYLFHGYNGTDASMLPAQLEPMFFWQAPDGDDSHRVMVRSTPYGAYTGDILGEGNEVQISNAINSLGTATVWSFDALLIQNGDDFKLAAIDTAAKIRNWNAKYSYPRLICATMDMFFSDIASQVRPGQIKAFSGDGNNEWVDEDATDAWALGIARRQDEFIPTAEKFSTIANALAGGGYPWTDIYQAYHRILTWHEHTDGTDFLNDEAGRGQHYETEKAEDREMVTESREFAEHALNASLPKLTGIIKTVSERNIVVFNPLAWKRTDVVHVPAEALGVDSQLVDGSTGKPVAHQILPDGQVVFVAENVPSTGYKTFSIQHGSSPRSSEPGNADFLESRFYRIQFDHATGAITSIRDKELNQELVDSAAPQRFNEYLYERYESPQPEKPSTWYRVSSASLQAYQGQVASVMTIKSSAVGVESLQQTVTLYNDLKRIDFNLDMVKSPSGITGGDASGRGFKDKESAYVALPLAIPDFEIKHELPGAVVEPIHQQFDGSTTAFYAVRHFTDISNARFGVTVSSPDVAMMEYGYPRSNPVLPYKEGEFEKKMEYPSNSHLYLYLLDNMFSVNILLDQRGPISFAWSMRSHTGNWQKGGADQFGWQVLNPLLPQIVEGRHSGTLPAASSFMSINKPNIVCSTLKPAEANGAGIILRFNKTEGIATTATVTLPFVGKISTANETSLVEEDQPVPLRINNGNEISFSILPFGVKTLRVINQSHPPLSGVSSLKGQPLSDMEVRLSWDARAEESSL